MLWRARTFRMLNDDDPTSFVEPEAEMLLRRQPIVRHLPADQDCLASRILVKKLAGCVNGIHELNPVQLYLAHFLLPCLYLAFSVGLPSWMAPRLPFICLWLCS